MVRHCCNTLSMNVKNPRCSRPTVTPPGYDALDPLVDQRIALGATQAEVAILMGIHPYTVKRYEGGKVSVISRVWIARYRDALMRFEYGISYDERIRQLSAALDRALDEMPADAGCRPFLRETLDRAGTGAFGEAA